MYCKKCGHPISPGAMFCKECGERITEENRVTEENGTAKISKPQKSGRTKKILIGVLILVCIGIGAVLLADNPVSNTKGITFDYYGDIPIGEAAEENLESVKWTSEKNADGSYTVSVRGIYEELSAQIGLDFNYTEDGEYCWATSESAYINGDYYTDDAAITMVMALIYGDNETAESALLWSMIG